MDKEYTLNFLIRTAEALARMFGSGCETLVHDMTRPNHPIIAIFNGHVSGRAVGSEQDIDGTVETPSDALSPDMVRAKNLIIGYKDHINQMAVTALGRAVKSSTINFVGEGYHYALGINFDYTALSAAASALMELSSVSGSLQSAIVQEEQSQLDLLFDECLQAAGMPIPEMKKRERLGFVELLYSKGAFNFQRAVAYIAGRMDVSRYTIYKYLHELEDRAESGE
jgi:predicted transcriptional regulator YheO